LDKPILRPAKPFRSFRDALYEKYRSSTRMKVLKKNCERNGSLLKLKLPLAHGLDGPIHTLAYANEEALRAKDVQAFDNLMKRSKASSATVSVERADASNEGNKQVPATEDTHRTENQQKSDTGKGTEEQLSSGSMMMVSSHDRPTPGYCLEDSSTSRKIEDQCRGDGLTPPLSHVVIGRKVALPSQFAMTSSQHISTHRATASSMGTTTTPRPHGLNGQATHIKEKGPAELDSSNRSDAAMDRIDDCARPRNAPHILVDSYERRLSEIQKASDLVPAGFLTNSGSAASASGVVRRVSCRLNDDPNQVSPVSYTGCHEHDKKRSAESARRFPAMRGIDADEVAAFDATLALALDEILPPADPKALQDFCVQMFNQTYMFGTANPPGTNR
jgi:hypothetical protein